MLRGFDFTTTLLGLALQSLTASRDLPDGYRIRFGGEAETMQETVGHMVKALVMAVIFIYIVLASQFGSFLQPLAIMASLPLSLIGVILGFLLIARKGGEQ